MGAVYVIEQLATGFCYVGSTNRPEKRWQEHRGSLRQGAHTSPRLQNSWNKHGEAAFAFRVVETCDDAVLIATEQRWLDRVGVFNAGRIAGRVEHTAEVRAKISAAHKGKKTSDAHRAVVRSPAHRAKLAEARKALYANGVSDARKAQLALARAKLARQD